MNKSQAAGFGLDQPLEQEIDRQLTELIALIEQTTPADAAIVERTDKLLQCVWQVSRIADVEKGDEPAGQCDLSAFRGTAVFALAICGKSRPGKDLSESAKEGMEPYNHGIEAYHVSVHRVGSAMTNLRRPGPGLKMLASVRPDPCEIAGESYEICIAKWENSLLFLVDGNLIHHYYDAGVYGPALQEGHLGIRHWRNTDVTYGDIHVHRLIAV